MVAQPSIDPQDRETSAAVVGGDVAFQSGSYALELLADTFGTRTCCFGTVMKDHRLFLWFYNACGIVYTQGPLSLVQDFEKVAALVIAIAGCTPERFGAFPPTVMKPLSPYPGSFPPTSLKGYVFPVQRVESADSASGLTELRVKLQASLTTTYALTGRRSFIYTATTNPSVDAAHPKNSSVVVKFSYQAAGRAPEQGIIQLARNAGVSHLPVVHAWKDLWKLEDSAFTIAVRQKKREAQVSAADIEELKATRNTWKLPLYEDRVFRAIVYPKYYSIRELFVERYDLIPVMVDQMIDCMSPFRSPFAFGPADVIFLRLARPAIQG